MASALLSFERNMAPLGEVTRWLSGGTPSKSNANYWSGTIPWISASTLKTVEISTSDQHLTPDAVAAGSKMAPLYSTLFLVRGSALHKEIRAGLVTAPVCFNQDVKALVPKAGLVPKFLTYSLLGRSYDLLKLVSSAGNSAGVLDTKLVQSLEIWLPSMDQQHAVAEALSDVDKLITALDRLIAKKQAIKRATMQQLLTGKTRLLGFTGSWCRARLKNIGNTYGGLTGKSGKDFGSGDSLYVPFMNIMANTSVSAGFLERVQISPRERQNQVLQGDLLFNTSSETPEELGMCAAVMSDLGTVYLNSFCFGFRLISTGYNPLFLAYLFRGDPGRSLMYSLAQGATRYNLSKRNFLELETFVPPRDEQNAITRVLSDMDAEIDALKQRRAKTKAIKQGMMQELLTGRTRLVTQGGAP